MKKQTVAGPESRKSGVFKPTKIDDFGLKINHHPTLAGEIAEIEREVEQEREAAEKERQRLEALREVTRFD